MREIFKRLIRRSSVELSPKATMQMALKIAEISECNKSDVLEAVQRTPGRWRLIKRKRGFEYRQDRDPKHYPLPYIFRAWSSRKGVRVNAGSFSSRWGGHNKKGTGSRLEISYREDDMFRIGKSKREGVIFTLVGERGEKVVETGVENTPQGIAFIGPLDK